MMNGAKDELLQGTCEAIVLEVAKAIDGEIQGRVGSLRMPTGEIVGRQIVVDAAEQGGLMNVCRLSILDATKAPAGEAARIEYEHDKQMKFGLQRVYSIQSVRRRGDKLVLLENFLAESAQHVREEDFRPILSESYAQTTVLKTLQDWTKYRAWQLQELRRSHAGGA